MVYTTDFRTAFPDWAEDTPLPLTVINESDASHYLFPAPRLTVVESSMAPRKPLSDLRDPITRSFASDDTLKKRTAAALNE